MHQSPPEKLASARLGMTGALICRLKIDDDGIRASLAFPDHIAPDGDSLNSGSWRDSESMH
jgi:hypothetical protein